MLFNCVVLSTEFLIVIVHIELIVKMWERSDVTVQPLGANV